MSQIIVEDPAMKAIMADPRLAAVRKKCSFHEICMIMKHTREHGCARVKPCQKCGSGAVIVPIRAGQIATYWRVECTNCDAVGPQSGSEPEAVRLWASHNHSGGVE